MNTERDKLILTREAAQVKRCHTISIIRQQTVGEHTFSALAILDFVYPDCNKVLWQALLYHDVPEALTGDLPATVKWKFPGLEMAMKEVENTIKSEYSLNFDLLPVERDFLKYADLMELALYCIEELRMGNRHFASIASRVLKAVERRNIVKLNERTELLYDFAHDELKETGETRDGKV